MWVVRAMMDVARVASISRRKEQVLKPSITGIWIARIMRSYWQGLSDSFLTFYASISRLSINHYQKNKQFWINAQEGIHATL